MPFLQVIQPGEANGALAGEYRAAIDRAGRVFGLLEAMSFRPGVMKAFLALFHEIMEAESALSSFDREVLAVVVSAANGSSYSTGAHVQLLVGEGATEELAESVARNWRSARLDPDLRALCELAEDLTLRPAEIEAAQIDRLRARGYTDAAVHDAIQVIALLGYANRIAAGVGLDDEPPGIVADARRAGSLNDFTARPIRDGV